LTDEPLQKSIPRRTDGWAQNWLAMPNHSMHIPVTFQRPQPTMAPDAGVKVQPHPPGGFTARPTDGIGATGAQPDEPSKGKMFGSPMDARQWYPEPGFGRPMDGPGTAPNDKGPFNPPQLGNTTTQTPGFARLSPSGSGLHDQPDPAQFSRGSGSIAAPQEYHPQISTASSTSGRKRVFK